MLEIIWRFRTAQLTDEAHLTALMSALAQLPGMSPRQYDLNQKEQWRAFDPRHVVVDTLTQRTQLVTIRGEASSAAAHSSGNSAAAQNASPLAMLALGKRGEQPTAIIRLPEAPLSAGETSPADEASLESQNQASGLVDAWSDIYEALSLESTLISSAAWRDALADAGLAPAGAGRALGLALGWSPESVPPGLRALDATRLQGSPIRLENNANHVALRLAGSSAELVEGPEHRKALEYIAGRLSSD